MVPVLVALLATGTAYGYGIGIHPTVRDSVYPVCAHNGVHFNKQGHANCGLHKGWATAGTTTAASTGPTGAPTTAPNHPAKPSLPTHPTRPVKPAKPDHTSHGRSASAPGHNKS